MPLVLPVYEVYSSARKSSDRQVSTSKQFLLMYQFHHQRRRLSCIYMGNEAVEFSDGKDKD